MKKWPIVFGFALLLLTINDELVAKQKKKNESDAFPTVDFRYSIPWWQTTVSLPDDPDKVLVGKEGQIFADFGLSRGPRGFNTFIHSDVVGGTEWVSQSLLSARVPILRTKRRAGSVDIIEETFTVIPSEHNNLHPPRLVRLGGEKRVTGFDGPKTKRVRYGWAPPQIACDPAFQDAAVSSDGLIEYALAVEKGPVMYVVIGFCEGEVAKKGERPLNITVEGLEPQQVDPVGDAGQNLPVVYVFQGNDRNNDGKIDIRIKGVTGSKNPHPMCSVIWAFAEKVPPLERIIAGLENDTAYAFANCGHERLPRRQYVSKITYSNKGDSTAHLTPKILAESDFVRFDRMRNTLVIGHNTHCQTTLIASIDVNSRRRFTATLQPFTLEPGMSETLVLTINRGGFETEPVSQHEVTSIQKNAVFFWEKKADLPYDKIQVPDPGIQNMLDASIRNIYQARDIKNGLPAFHVGPTHYRCLWIVDGAFLLEAATLLGRADEARAGIDYMMSFQQADGGFQLKDRYWKEGGLVLWAVTRHAFLTQDQQWLLQHWDNLKRVVAWIQNLRTLEGAADPDAPEYRLLPWGDIDGGINNYHKDERKGEYSNIYWSLIGMKSAIQAATWLGENETAKKWQHQFDDFYATFQTAAQRDLRPDPYGNIYLPIIMNDALQALPQRAQWSFCHAVYPGQLFAQENPIVVGTLNMLKTTEVQGMVFNTGWMQDGIWTYFASFYGHALLWQGEGQKAVRVLYDFANHAAPTMVWREEQKPVGQGHEEVGDMPHNWASAEFIRLAIHVLALDRGDELHLLEGLPPQWLGPGMETALNGVATPFGDLFLNLKIDRTGETATLSVEPLKERCKAIVVHLPGGGVEQLLPEKGGQVTFHVSSNEK
ncbi:hypothetical protein JXA70_10465 [candidate division KSB1 bacterium]|nr:hypothetical protein [candidate division KSB1 bacterium]